MNNLFRNYPKMTEQHTLSRSLREGEQRSSLAGTAQLVPTEGVTQAIGSHTKEAFEATERLAPLTFTGNYHSSFPEDNNQ